MMLHSLLSGYCSLRNRQGSKPTMQGEWAYQSLAVGSGPALPTVVTWIPRGGMAAMYQYGVLGVLLTLAVDLLVIHALGFA
jgi:hypothetical protein